MQFCGSLSVASFAIIFSHSEGCLFTLLIVSFVVQKFLILIRSHLFIFAFISSLCPMQDTACLGLVHGDDPERSYGEGGGRGVHVWEHMYTRGGFMSMYCKTNTVL